MLGPCILSVFFPNKWRSCDVFRISSILLLLSAMKLQVALCLLLFAFACFAYLGNLQDWLDFQLKWPAGQLQMSNLSSIPCPMCLSGFGALLRLSRHVASKWMLWLQDLVPEFLITFCSTAPWSSVCQCISSPCCLPVFPSSAGAGVCMTTFCFPVAGRMWCMCGRAKTCFQHLPTVFAFLLLWWYQSRFVGWKPVRMRLQWCISGALFSAGRLSGDIHEKLKVREPDEAVGEATSSESDLYDEEGGLKSADQAG